MVEIDRQTERNRQVFTELSAPISIQWELTPWCNQRCVHCYNYWRTEALPALHPTGQDIEIYNKVAKDITENKVFNVTVTGGEPLAVLKWAYPSLEKLAKEGVDLSINTNLTVLTAEKVRLL